MAMEEEIKLLKLEIITLKEDFENIKAEINMMKNEKEVLIMGSAANETQELESKNKDDDKIQDKISVIIPERLELEIEINDNKKENTKEEPNKVDEEEL